MDFTDWLEYEYQGNLGRLIPGIYYAAENFNYIQARA